MRAEATLGMRLSSGAALLLCAACTAPAALHNPDVTGLRAVVSAGDTVRATTAAAATQEFALSGIDDDGTLHGTTAAGEPLTLRLEDVAAIEYRRAAPGRTVAVVLGALFGAGLIDAHDSCKPEGPYGTPACATDP